MEDQFKQLVARLTPRPSANKRCIAWLQEYSGDFAVPFGVFMDVLVRGSLNARARLVHLLEIGAGAAGSTPAPEPWNVLVAQNLQKIVDAAVPAHLAPAALINLKPALLLVSRLRDVGRIDATAEERVSAQLKSKGATLESLAALKRPSNYYASKDEVLRRMEDDRERSKAYRQEAKLPPLGSEEEFEMMYARIEA